MDTYIWQDLIDRARLYVDDDHDDQAGWIKPTQWLNLGIVEYRLLYKRWVRMDLFRPPWTETVFQGPSTNLTGVLAILGVAQYYAGNNIPYRVLDSMQQRYGRAPFSSAWQNTPANAWEAVGTGDALTVTISPPDQVNQYAVRWVSTPAVPSALTDTVTLPMGCDERLVLGMARRASLKDGQRSALLQRMIDEQDADLNMQSFGAGPRVTVKRPTGLLSWVFDPRMWRYF